MTAPMTAAKATWEMTMDGELVFWICFFVGGYSLAVGILLRIALKKGHGDSVD